MKKILDERGFSAELLREDWENVLDGDEICRGIKTLGVESLLTTYLTNRSYDYKNRDEEPRTTYPKMVER